MEILVKNIASIKGFAKSPRVPTDILVGESGEVKTAGSGILAPDATVLDAAGLTLCPGWTDLHTHIYWGGGTDISVWPANIGLKRGVTTLNDAGSAGAANFAGLRRFLLESAEERVYAFLNIGLIGLVACNQVSELGGVHSINIGKTLKTIEENRGIIRGVKVRASHVITGNLDLWPLKVGLRIAGELGLPLMVHIGEPPPFTDDILDLLSPGDIVTHCFHGKPGGTVRSYEPYKAAYRKARKRGVFFDVGHGTASFDYETSEQMLAEGFLPDTLSSDLHGHNIAGPVFELSTILSRFLALGMEEEAIIDCVTTKPREILGLERPQLCKNALADFTLYSLQENSLPLPDPCGKLREIPIAFEPEWTVLGSRVTRCKSLRPKKKKI